MKLPFFRTGPRAGLLAAALLGTLALTPLALRAEPARLTAPRASLAPAPAQAGQGEFARQFRQAMKLGAKEEMVSLVRKYPADAEFHILGICVAIARQSSDELEEEIEALRVAWKGAMGSNFVEHIYNYFSSLQMSNTLRTAWTKLKVEYDQVNRRYTKAQQERQYGKLFPALAAEMAALASAFEEVGDDYMAGTCWLQAAQAYDEELAVDSADYVKALECLQKGVPLLEKIELKNQLYINSKNRLASLSGRAAAGPEGAAGGPGDEAGAGEVPAGLATKIPGIDLGPAVEVPMTYELFPDLEAVPRPIYSGDELYPSWNALNLRAVGSTDRFPAMNEFRPEVIRTGSAKVSIDTTGDGTGDVEIPIKGKLLPVELEIGTGEMRHPWAFLAVTLGETEGYQNVETNLAPTDQYMGIYVAPAASMVGEIGDTQVRVIDENMDGLYGSPPAFWNFVGLTEGSSQPEIDSLVVDGEKTARPWSEYQEIDGQWYRIESKAGGKILEASPATLTTGTLRLDFKGGRPDFLIVRGLGKLENAYFDLTAGGKKGIEVPVGRYELFSGLLGKGKRRQRMKALILPPRKPEAYEVKADEVTPVELGAPFGFDFEVEADKDWVTVKGKSVCVTGTAGERYERTWNCVPHPEVSVREVGAKRGGKSQDMPLLLDQETLFLEGFVVAWFPFDLTVENKKGGDVEVQLVEKKNKLFGSIESEWK